MNLIRYIGYDIKHGANFVFDLPNGHDCWLFLLTHTPAYFYVDGQLEEYPLTLQFYFHLIKRSIILLVNQFMKMIGFALTPMRHMFVTFQFRASLFATRSRVLSSNHKIISVGACRVQR